MTHSSFHIRFPLSSGAEYRLSKIFPCSVRTRTHARETKQRISVHPQIASEMTYPESRDGAMLRIALYLK